MAKLFETQLGHEAGRFYVNSAQSVSRDGYASLMLPDGRMLPAGFDGSVDSAALVEALGLNPIVGQVALRTWFENQELHGQKISKASAKNFVVALRDAGLLSQMHTDTGIVIEYAPEGRLKGWLQDHTKNKHSRAGRRSKPLRTRIIAGTIIVE